MVSIRVRAKFRILGMDLGKFDQTNDITGTVLLVLGYVANALKITLPPDALTILKGQKLPATVQLFNARGVLVELQ